MERKRFVFGRRAKPSRTSSGGPSDETIRAGSDHVAVGTWGGSNYGSNGGPVIPQPPPSTPESASNRTFRLPGRERRRTKSVEPIINTAAVIAQSELESSKRGVSVTFTSDTKVDPTTLESMLPNGFKACSNHFIDTDLVIQNHGLHIKASKTCMAIGNQIIPLEDLKRVALRRLAARDNRAVSAGVMPEPSLSNLISKKANAPNFAYPALNNYLNSSIRGSFSSKDLETTPVLQRATTTPDSSNNTSQTTDVYYFEVMLQTSGSTIRVGLVAKDEVRLAGEAPNSIALSSDGILFVSGRPVAKDGATFNLEQPRPWTTPPLMEGESFGVGVEIMGMRRIFFTRNGLLLAQPTSFGGFNIQDTSFVPAVVVVGELPCNVVEVTATFNYNCTWQGSDRLSVIPANEPLATGTIDESGDLSMDLSESSFGKSRGGLVTQELTFSPVVTSQSTPIFGRRNPRRSSLEDDLPNVDGIILQKFIPQLLDVTDDISIRQAPLPTTRVSTPRSVSPKPPPQSSQHSTFAGSTESIEPIGNRNYGELHNDDLGLNISGMTSATVSIATKRIAPSSISVGGRVASTARMPDTSVGASWKPDVASLGPTSPAFSSPSRHAPSNSREEEDQLNAALQQSQQSAQKKKKNRNKVMLMTYREIEDAKACARELRTCCQNDVDTSLVKNLLQLCRSMQSTVKKALEDAMKYDSSMVDLEELFTLNDIVLDAIQTAEAIIEAQEGTNTSDHLKDIGNTKPAAHDSTIADIFLSTSSISRVPPATVQSTGSQEVAKTTPVVRRQTTRSLEIDALVRKKDIFSLICMLRAQSDKRLDSAMALMRFSREAERTGDIESIRLRNEIRSSGGMHSLLTLFRTKGTTRESKVVAALAVAYLLPSIVESTQLSSPSVGLKIVECLRCLFSSKSVCPKGEEISQSDMFNASALGLTTFWINSLFPMLQKDTTKSGGIAATPLQRKGLQYRSRGRQLQIGSGGGTFDQKQLEVQELLEMTVSLIVNMAKLDDQEIVGTSSTQGQHTNSIINLRYTLVEQMCAVDVARPIAVREGLLKVLVGWMKSKDREKVRPAATALRDLTSTQDKYMAGWIHSQIVSEGALREIVELAVSESVGHDVRLGVSQILSSLCVAPHTRAAVVEAQCINYLIPLLYDHSDPSSQQVAFAAGSALLQLAAGALTRASVYSEGFLNNVDNETAPADKLDTVINDIVHGGAIGPLVAMARSCVRGKLRAMSIEALRVISEDTNPTRLTRLQLCDDGAAEALGYVLKDDVDDVCNLLQMGGHVTESKMERQSSDQLSPSGVVRELHQSLCALANILDPAEGVSGSLPPSLQYTQSRLEESEKTLIRGCIQTAQSGGLQSLLKISAIPFTTDVSSEGTQTIDRADLLLEASRCLASLSPLLLSDLAAVEGFTAWTCDVLHALTLLLKQSAENEECDETGLSSELKNDALRGLGALAKSEPLKILIVDKSLKYLLQAKVQRGDRTDVSNAAGHVCLSLGFEEDELAVQVAGNDPKLLGDWFCLQRSLLIQAMAREEIRRLLTSTWIEAIAEAKRKGILQQVKLARENSGQSSTSSMNRSSSGDVSNDGIEEIFENLATDEESAEQRRMFLTQYENVYEPRGRETRVDLTSSDSSDNHCVSDDEGLLARQVYPLNTACNEKDWILAHQKALLTSSKDFMVCGKDRVQRLLDCCIPSRLLQNDVLPRYDLRPEASFNFRALVMAQRRYFSFRREGQLVSRLCDKHAAALDSDDVHWTLGFTNSSFAGEFSETLVQALYRCPMIRGLSFTRNAEWKLIHAIDVGNEAEEGSALLANLAGSLPPWVSYLTYDNILNDRAVKALVAILETMGKLASGQGPLSDSSRMKMAPGQADSVNQRQGAFSFLAIRNSPHLGTEVWGSFIGLLGNTAGQNHLLSAPRPLATLRILDLSGNNLGDDACAFILDVIHNRHSHCSLEQLDLSTNSIRQGKNVTKSLRSYIELHRYNQSAGVKVTKRTWRSMLHTLNLSSNQLFSGGLALEIIAFLKNNALTLKSLDISNNGLDAENYQFTEVLCGALNKNTLLRALNLSRNNFTPAFLDTVLDRLNRSESESGLNFLCFDNNSPSLDEKQNQGLDNFMRRTRKTTFERYIVDKERIRNGESLDDPVIAERSSSFTLYDVDIAPAIEDNEDISAPSTDLALSFRPNLQMKQPEKGENMITVLFSAPLVFHDDQRKLRPFAKLDFDMERELLWQCLKEASRDIELSFDNATHHRLLAAMTKRCSCLHYSGHGHPTYLPLENGKGGPHWLEVNVLEDLIVQGGGAPFKFVFVSACHSGLAGETFASAGVPHVVCCQQESELKDAAALAFTRQFYLALAVGHTVKESFEQGCKAVRATPNLRNAEEEMKKFVLLPRDGNHDVPIFNANPLREWPRTGSSRVLQPKRSSTRGKGLQRSRSLYFGGARSSELSVRNMMQEDPSPTPPQFFLGREVDMYHVLNAILSKRLVTVVGETGVGRSSLVCAICHYINERSSTILEFDRIFFVKRKQGRGGDRCRLLIHSLLDKLVEAGKALQQQPDMHMEDLFEVICNALKNTKALIVFDRTELFEGNDEAQDFPLFLSNLFRGTRNVRVMLTCHRALGIPSIGGVIEQQYHLGPLNFANTVRLFANLCPHLHTPGERQNFFHQLVTDADMADCLPTDSGIAGRTACLFRKLGDGKPSGIEKAAYGMPAEEVRSLGRD